MICDITDGNKMLFLSLPCKHNTIHIIQYKAAQSIKGPPCGNCRTKRLMGWHSKRCYLEGPLIKYISAWTMRWKFLFIPRILLLGFNSRSLLGTWQRMVLFDRFGWRDVPISISFCFVVFSVLEFVLSIRIALEMQSSRNCRDLESFRSGMCGKIVSRLKL